MALAWTVTDKLPLETYSVSLKLWDDAGVMSGQSDFGLRAPGFGWQLAKLPIDGLSPGHYRLTLTIYDWQTGVRLTGMADVTTGDELPIAEIHLPLAPDAPHNHETD